MSKNTLTVEQITEIATRAAIAAVQAHLSAHVDLSEPAVVTETAPVQAQDEAPEAKVLTRSAWKTARMTRNGKVRKAFVGLTREQALEAGLLPGYVMPTGAMREHLSELADA